MTHHETVTAYQTQLVDRLNRFFVTQQAVMVEAAKIIAEATQNQKRFLVFGSGHSHMIAEEFYARAGGLATVTPMLQNELMLTDHPLKSTLIERTLAMASVYAELYHLEAGDVILIASNSGRNALTVELARLAKASGLTVIAFTNLEQSQTVRSRHPSGKQLIDYADLVIDNCGAIGDAGFDVGQGLMMGSSSTVIGAAMAQTLSILIALNYKHANQAIPVFRSSNLDGADADNAVLMKRYTRQY